MALKIVYKICCGIDVHKTFVVACIASTNDKGVTTYESHRFSTYTKGQKIFYGGYPKGTARMSACNLLVNNGSLFTVVVKLFVTLIAKKSWIVAGILSDQPDSIKGVRHR